jgi:hypothetical protein
MKLRDKRSKTQEFGYSYGISGMGGYEEDIEETETSLFGEECFLYDPRRLGTILIATAIGKEAIDLM